MSNVSVFLSVMHHLFCFCILFSSFLWNVGVYGQYFQFVICTVFVWMLFVLFLLNFLWWMVVLILTTHIFVSFLLSSTLPYVCGMFVSIPPGCLMLLLSSSLFPFVNEVDSRCKLESTAYHQPSYCFINWSLLVISFVSLHHFLHQTSLVLTQLFLLPFTFHPVACNGCVFTLFS